MKETNGEQKYERRREHRECLRRPWLRQSGRRAPQGQLVREICGIIKRRKLTQAKAAVALGLKQPRCICSCHRSRRQIFNRSHGSMPRPAGLQSRLGRAPQAAPGFVTGNCRVAGVAPRGATGYPSPGKSRHESNTARTPAVVIPGRHVSVEPGIRSAAAQQAEWISFKPSAGASLPGLSQFADAAQVGI